ncbi:MAG: GEVED domain-containing protein, partial [Cyanobacteria bacterium J06642_11]
MLLDIHMFWADATAAANVITDTDPGVSVFTISVGGTTYATLTTVAGVTTAEDGTIEYFNGATGNLTTMTSSGAADPVSYNGTVTPNQWLIELPASVAAAGDLVITADSTAGGSGVHDDFVIDSIEALTCVYDYSDAPADGGTAPDGSGTTAYGEETHILTGPQLGATITNETSAVENADNASDDGITLATLTEGDTSYTIPSGNITATGTGTLHAWVDFDKDGTFEPGEYASVAVTSGTPAGDLNWSGITAGTAGNTYARFRFTSDTSINANTPGGAASDGEVEDYQVAIASSSLPISISGRVFEDINYGGGAGRDYTTADTASTLPIDTQNATVELYELQGGNYIKVADTTTAADGTYSFSDAVVSDNNTYRVRVVNTTVKSRRAGGGDSELAVQTFRNDPDATTPAITNEVGGSTPASQDAGTQSNGTNLSTLTAQSVTEIALSGSGVANVDFGFNFDTIVNTNDVGQGSLAQFITNANELGDEASLAQQGNRKDKFNANEPLPAGFENSIFMIPSASDPLGRTADPNFNASRGVAEITVVNDLGFFNGFDPSYFPDNSNLDATTQTVNIGDTNTGTLGTGGTVGVNGLILDPVQRPEVELFGGQQGDGLAVGVADSVTIRGLAMYNFFRSLQIDNATNVTIEQNIVGSFADSHTDPGAQRDSDVNLRVIDSTNVTIRNNLLGFSGNRDSADIARSSILYENNECQSPGRTSTIGDCIVNFTNSTQSIIRG